MTDGLFPRRVGRFEFFRRFMALIAVTICLMFSELWVTDGLPLSKEPPIEFAYMWFPTLALIVIYGIFFLWIPRLRDIGISPWFVVILFIPEFITSIQTLVLIWKMLWFLAAISIPSKMLEDSTSRPKLPNEQSELPEELNW